MTMRRVGLWSLAAACCWSVAVCLAEDGSADLINDIDPPVVLEFGVELNAAPPVEARPVEIGIEDVEIRIEEKPQPGAAGARLTTRDAIVGKVGGAGEVEPGKYWIGLLCVDPGEALRAQLGLGEGVGLLVEAVTDDSPAKKAGILQHDVLVTLNDKINPTVRVLKQVKDLVEAVQLSETKPLFLELVRKGQREVIEVVPAERPKPTEVRDVLIQNFDARLEEQHLGRSLGLRMAGPVFAYAAQSVALPEGMTMEFHQVVGQPEKITVKMGERTWELTEVALDKAPQEVRIAVWQQLAARRAGLVPQVLSLPRTSAVHDAGWFNRTLSRTNPAAADPNSQPTPPATQAEAYARAQARAAEAAADDAARANLILHEVDLFNHLRVTGLSPLVVTATAMILPDDVTVAIVRKGAEPAKITVKKGEQTWDVTEKELGKLPEELRKHADSALRGQAPQAWKTRTVPAGVSAPKVSYITIQPPMAPAATAEHDRVAVEAQQRRAAAVAEQVQKQMEQRREQREKIEQHEIREQLKKLNDKIEKLQQALEKPASKQ